VETRDRTRPRWRPDTPLDTRTFYRRRREARTWFDKTANPPRIQRTRPRTPDRRRFSRSRNRPPISRSTSSRNRSPARVSSVSLELTHDGDAQRKEDLDDSRRLERTLAYADRTDASTEPVRFAHPFAFVHRFTPSRVASSNRPLGAAFENAPRLSIRCRQCTSPPTSPTERSRGR